MLQYPVSLMNRLNQASVLFRTLCDPPHPPPPHPLFSFYIVCPFFHDNFHSHFRSSNRRDGAVLRAYTPNIGRGRQQWTGNRTKW